MVKKEYPGGLTGEMETTLPAVLGVQASDEPPRYVAVSKVRQAMKTASNFLLCLRKNFIMGA